MASLIEHDAQGIGADIRHAALRHSLLSYVFGTGIVATAINLVASLSSK